ncbi:outer membrane protein assembly factor BamB family protein [Natronomonas sp.]|uniref:outer membrane protein assembly factor BamB family protein n=1 Tax=Natronomonas sp. TaxID=2184060 RepID=UPI002FC37782
MPSRRRVLCAASSLAAVGVAGCTDDRPASRASPGTDADTEWPQPGGSDRFDCYRADAVAPRESPDERWAVETVWPAGRPIVADERVILPTQAGLVAYGLDGEERWRLGFDDDEIDVRTAPIVVDGIGYAGTRGGLLSFSVEDGTTDWEVELEGSPQTAPVVDYDREHLVVGTDEGLSGVDTGGERIWQRETFADVSALASWGDSLYAGTEGGKLYAYYDLEEPQGMWQRQLDGRVVQIALLNGDGVVVSVFGGPTSRRDGESAGDARWSTEAGTHGFVVAGNTYAVGGGLTAVHTRTGEQRWAVDDHLRAPPAGAGDTVYTGGDGFVVGYAMNGGTGVGEYRMNAERWRYEVDGAVTTGLAVADGAVFATAMNDDGDTTLYALE